MSNDTGCSIFGCTRLDIRARGLCRPHYHEVTSYGVVGARYPGGGYRAFCTVCGQPFESRFHPLSGGCFTCSSECSSLRMSRIKSAPDPWTGKLCFECKEVFPSSRSDRGPLCGSCRIKQWVRNNREHVRRYGRAYYQKNKDSRPKTVYNAEYQRQYRKENLERMRVLGRRHAASRRARKLASKVVEFSVHAVRDRSGVWGNTCWMCGGPYEHDDHVKPLKHDGAHAPSNLRPACAACNLRKAAKWPIDVSEWRRPLLDPTRLP